MKGKVLLPDAAGGSVMASLVSPRDELFPIGLINIYRYLSLIVYVTR